MNPTKPNNSLATPPFTDSADYPAAGGPEEPQEHEGDTPMLSHCPFCAGPFSGSEECPDCFPDTAPPDMGDVDPYYKQVAAMTTVSTLLSNPAALLRLADAIEDARFNRSHSQRMDAKEAK